MQVQGYGQPKPQDYYPLHQEPQQQPSVVVVSQPQSKGQQQNVVQWSSGMYGCCEDVGGCMYCFFCHPCFMCTLASRMGECVSGPLCLGCPFETAMRTKLRAQYGIHGSVLNDVCTMLWCNPCAKHQMSREIKSLGYRP